MMKDRSSNTTHSLKNQDRAQTPCNGMGIWLPMDNLKMIKAYFGQNLGDFYTHSTNRLLLYPFFFSFFLVECATFWLLYLGPAFVLDYMAFITVYTLHKAAVCVFRSN